MSRAAAVRLLRQPAAISRHQQLDFARKILESEASAVTQLGARLGDSFLEALELLFSCRGSVFVTGVGKAGLIGQKMAATLASTGSPSHFLHPAEAFHGDLGRIQPDDVVVLLSLSGESSEVVRLLPVLRRFGNQLVAMTGAPASRLAQAADIVLSVGAIEEACHLHLAPSSSTTAMLALGDALALTLSRMRNLKPDDFARNHPGGSLGLRLRKVEEQMRPLRQCRVARLDETVRNVLVASTMPGRRTGAVILVDEAKRLRGLFTDSDLSRLVEQRQEAKLDLPIQEVMTNHPTTISVGATLESALELLAEHKISELPVVTDSGEPVGLIDVTDIVGLSADVLPPAMAAHHPQVRVYPEQGA